MEGHLPKRPTWECGNCGRPWPCAKAQNELSLEYQGNRSSLLLYLALLRWSAFDDFAADGATSPEIDDRFFAWLR